MTRNEALNVIGNNIKRLLDNHGATQRDLAKAIGVHESAVGKWILGENGPKMGSVQKMADYFNVRISDILEENPPQDYSPKKKYLMDRIAKADDRKIDKLNKLMELIEDEEADNW